MTPTKDRKEGKKIRSDTEKTELEILVERTQDKVTSKARHHWAILRDSVVSAKDVSCFSKFLKHVYLNHFVL